MSRVPTALIAAVAIVVGFAVAQTVAMRELGAVVLVASVAWCVLREARRTAWWRLTFVVLVGAGCFVMSHVLAEVLGAWLSVLLAGAVLGVVTYALVDRPRGH